jgi:hypothetical protein
MHTNNKEHKTNNFEFKKLDDLILFKNGIPELEFSSITGKPYFSLPVQFWLLEKQITGNDFFKEFKGKHHSELLQGEYGGKFWTLGNVIIPKSSTLPASEHSFKDTLQRSGLYLMDISSLCILEMNNDSAIIKKILPNENKTNSLKYSSADIHSVNVAYQKFAVNSNDDIAKKVYNEIAHQIYIDSTIKRLKTTRR